uniref:AB hydrolase-1 domain-containing protein n=1 Tax=Moniliophthora roreri TaxID=221103 RepID=A0A0W0FBF7_MONRR
MQRRTFWSATQPPGPVILIGHSMGGLLSAEATTDPSIVRLRPRRIVGMIAFDCPYLGMHPHVVITGIASLLPNKSEDGKTEKDMNVDPDVKIVDDKVTDDWERYKRSLDRNISRSSLHSPQASSGPDTLSPRSPSPLHSRSPSPNSLVDRTINFLSSHSDDQFVKWVRKHSDDPFSAGKQWIVEYFQFGSCMFDPSGLKDRYTRLVEWNGPWVNYWTVTLPKHKGSEGSLSASSPELGEALVKENNLALMENGVADNISFDTSSTHSSQPSLSFSTSSKSSIPSMGEDQEGDEKATKAALKEQQKAEKERLKQQKRIEKERAKEVKAAARAAAREKGKEKVGRHFVVLPTGLGAILGGGDKWEKVLIAGVDDEVAAHCGMFIPGQNLDYEGLVERVGGKSYVEQLAGVPKEALEQAGTDIVVVGCGEWKAISYYAGKTGFKGRIYTESTRELYHTLGMDIETTSPTPAGQEKRSYASGSYVGNVMRGMAEFMKNPSLIGKQGNVSQIGGDFVFGPGNTCSYAHFMQHTEDRKLAPSAPHLRIIDDPLDVEVAELMQQAGVQYQ